MSPCGGRRVRLTYMNAAAIGSSSEMLRRFGISDLLEAIGSSSEMLRGDLAAVKCSYRDWQYEVECCSG